jgi:hypothetical protein
MKTVALFLYAVLGLGFLGLGTLYLVTDEFMPYHSDAIAESWESLAPGYQGLFLGLLKGLGAGAFTSGVALISMTVLSFMNGFQRYKYPLAVVAWTYSCLLTYAIYVVYTQTPSEPPIAGGIAWIVLALAASAFAHVASRAEA